MSSNMTVATTIIQQLANSIGRLTAMIGAYNFVGSENGVSFRFKARAKNGANGVRIVLDPSDTYTVEFFSVRAGKYKVKNTFSDIYNDSLTHLFENVTGLYLSI